MLQISADPQRRNGPDTRDKEKKYKGKIKQRDKGKKGQGEKETRDKDKGTNG